MSGWKRLGAVENEHIATYLVCAGVFRYICTKNNDELILLYLQKEKEKLLTQSSSSLPHQVYMYLRNVVLALLPKSKNVKLQIIEQNIYFWSSSLTFIVSTKKR